MTTNAGTWAVRPTLDSNLSRQMVDAAVAEASALSMSVTVVAVDESGVIKELCTCWATCTRRAAEVKLASSATATKYLMCRNSTFMARTSYPPPHRKAQLLSRPRSRPDDGRQMGTRQRN